MTDRGPRTGKGRAAFWLALAGAGQLCALLLTRAGKEVGYQHLLVPAEWTTRHVVPLAVLALQTIAIAIAGRDLPRRMLAWARDVLPGWRFWAFILLFPLTAATLSADPRRYLIELVLAAALQVVMLVTVVQAARSLPDGAAARLGARIDRWLGTPGPEELAGTAGPLRPDRFAWMAAAWTFFAAAFLAIFVYGAHPHVPDEAVYLLHGRYFAEGRLWMDPPPVEPAFRLGLMTLEDARWYSPVPPAWPALLAVGVRLGVPYLVNPLLAALSVILGHGLLGGLYGRRTARLGTLLLVVSPWFLFMAMSFMTHMLSTVAALAAAWCVARLRSGGSVGWVIPGGFAIGVVGLTRPLEGVIVAGLLGLWLLTTPAFGLRTRVGRLVGLALASAATASITLPYNRILTGDPLRFPLMEYTDRIYGAGTNALGFGANRGLGWSGLDPLPGHGPLDVLVNGNLNLFGLNTELLGWACGSLVVLLIGILATKRTRSDRLLIVATVTVIGVHSFYWFSGGPDFGPRYWYLILLPCIGLAARGVETVARHLEGAEAPRVYFAVGSLTLLAALVFVPWRSIDKYHEYRGMQPGMRRLAEEVDMGRGLVLIRGSAAPDYASAAVYNAIDLSSDAPVYALDAGPRSRVALAAAFPDRPVWIVDGPTRSGAGYRVVEGPLPPGRIPDDPIGDVDAFEDRPAPGDRVRREASRADTPEERR